MIDYNNSENASSLIGMLKQGGGLVNIGETQVIEGYKQFKRNMAVVPSVGDSRCFTAYSEVVTMSSLQEGWYRIGEVTSWALNAIIMLTSRYDKSKPTLAQISIQEGASTVMSLISPYRDNLMIPQFRYKSNGQLGEVKYFSIYSNTTYEGSDVIVTILSTSRYATYTIYTEPVADTDIEGYTNYDLDLVSST